MTLADAIRHKGTEDAEAVRQKARADAETYRTDKARAVEEERRRLAQELAAVAEESARAANAGAEREARTVVATAKAALSDRLYRIAARSLPEFRDSTYPELFAALAAEIPAHAWQRVRVNPADQKIAHDVFPDGEIVPDPAIAGGLDVEANDGRVRIANTLEARLEAAWPAILPGLMNDVLEATSHS